MASSETVQRATTTFPPEPWHGALWAMQVLLGFASGMAGLMKPIARGAES